MISIAVLFVTLWCSAIATTFPECQPQNKIQLTAGQSAQIYSPNYPRGFDVPSGCQTTITAPVFNLLQIECRIYIAVKITFF